MCSSRTNFAPGVSWLLVLLLMSSGALARADQTTRVKKPELSFELRGAWRDVSTKPRDYELRIGDSRQMFAQEITSVGDAARAAVILASSQEKALRGNCPAGFTVERSQHPRADGLDVISRFSCPSKAVGATLAAARANRLFSVEYYRYDVGKGRPKDLETEVATLFNSFRAEGARETLALELLNALAAANVGAKLEGQTQDELAVVIGEDHVRIALDDLEQKIADEIARGTKPADAHARLLAQYVAKLRGAH
jgi:hypothetical protein